MRAASTLSITPSFPGRALEAAPDSVYPLPAFAVPVNVPLRPFREPENDSGPLPGGVMTISGVELNG